jgi:hypothetical protein
MKLGSSAGRSNKPTTPTSDASHTYPDMAEGNKPTRKPGLDPKKSVIPRTRDDSSDEDEPPTRPQGPLIESAPPLIGHRPILPHPFPGSYPPPPHHHVIPIRGGSEQFYAPHGGRGIVGPAPLPPHSVATSGGGILPHHMPPPSSGGGILPPHHMAPPPMVHSKNINEVHGSLILLKAITNCGLPYI